MTAKKLNVAPHWEPRYCGGEPSPKKYRWEVDETGDGMTRAIVGYVRETPTTFRIEWDSDDENRVMRMTKEQAIAIASALNALDSIDETEVPQ